MEQREWTMLAIGAAMLAAAVVWGAEDGTTAGGADGWAALRERAPAISVTVYPVNLGGRPMDRVAAVVATMLEQASVPEIDVARRTLPVAPGEGIEETARRFGEEVAQAGVGTDCALYAEYLGAPGDGVQEIRMVMVDGRGHLLWSERQRPGDAVFDRVRPRNPMTCTVVVAERLREELGLPDPDREGAPEGRWARFWRDASGFPAKPEMEAMERRRETLRGRTEGMEMEVISVLVGTAVDEPGVAQLASELEETGKFKGVTAASSARRFEIAPDSNEQKRLWDLAKAVKASLRDRPASVPYALAAEFVMAPGDHGAHTVHWILCDGAGDWVVVDYQNEYKPDFRRIAPRTVADCRRLVADRVVRLLGP